MQKYFCHTLKNFEGLHPLWEKNGAIQSLIVPYLQITLEQLGLLNIIINISHLNIAGAICTLF
jgi:hypothetical protein